MELTFTEERVSEKKSERAVKYFDLNFGGIIIKETMADGSAAQRRKVKSKSSMMPGTLNYVGAHLSYEEATESCKRVTKNCKGQKMKAQVQCTLRNAFLNRKRPVEPTPTEELSNLGNCAPSPKSQRLKQHLSSEVETANAMSPSSETTGTSKVHLEHTELHDTVRPSKYELHQDKDWSRSRGAMRMHDTRASRHNAHDFSLSAKTGADAFVEFCVSPDLNARLTMEGYREQIEEIIKHLKRYDLIPTLTRNHNRSCVNVDPVESYYLSPSSQSNRSGREGPVLRSQSRKAQQNTRPGGSSQPEPELKSCDVKMRVRIQYKSHNHVLSNIDSVKASHEERQFDKYFQAASIMRSRDTGSVVCDISFTDITYLGAFWRDYTNGSLQEALRAVFLTEMMRQTAGDEELDLFVSIDENDFVKGQRILISNLSQHGGRKARSYNVRSRANTARIER